MSASTIIHFIQGLTLEEQNFVIEQILKLRQKNKQKQAEFAEIGSDFVERKEIAATSGVEVDEAFDRCFALLSNLSAERDAVEQGYSDYINGNVKPHLQIKERLNEEVLVLPDWQKEILMQCLEDVKNGNVVSDEQANKIFEQYIFGVPQTLEQLKNSVESAEKQYEMGLGKSNEEVFNKYEQWL